MRKNNSKKRSEKDEKTKAQQIFNQLASSKAVITTCAVAFTFLSALYITLFALGWYAGGLDKMFAVTNGVARFFCYLLLISILLFTTLGFMYFFNRDMIGTAKNVVLIMLVIAIVFTLCIILSDYISIYVMPFALAAMIIGVIISVRVAIIVNILLSQMLFLTVALFSPMAEFSMASLSASIFANLALGFIMISLIGRNFSRLKFDLYGLAGGVIVMPFVVLTTFITNGTEYEMLMNMLWIFVSNLIATVIFMPILPIFESLFNVVTSYKLDELCSTDQKLLKKLKEEAPGTYNHSVIVSNIAESCAYAIGENTKLTRCAALYHDVGKLVSPEYFVENQENGYNPHDDLIPEVSVKMITQHTKNGYDIIKKYRLPEEIAKVAVEHHGTVPVKYFYVKAQNIADEKLDMKMFAYEGPKPTTKISAIIMIADTIEAATRAGMPDTIEEYSKFVERLINEKRDLGQFDDCPITMKELTTIKDTIIKDVPNMYHSRIKYPEVRKRK